MGGVWYRFLAEARQRAASWMVLGLVVGVGAGALLAALAGARRTTDAYDRFVVAHDGLDVVVTPVDFCTPQDCDPYVVEHLEAVAESVRIVVANVVGGRMARDTGSEPGSFLFAGSADGRFGTDINRSLVVDGRAPKPDAADETMVSQSLAQQLDVRVGDGVELDVVTGIEGDGDVLTVELRVVGIEVAPNELEPLSGGALNVMYATPALIEERPELFPFEVVGVRLHGGAAARTAFVRDLEALDLQADATVDSLRHRDAAHERFRDDALSLVVFAALGGLATFVVVGQALHRQQVLDAADDDRLRELGCARTDLRRIALLRAAVVAFASAVVAMCTAIALSPLAPIGEARAIEVDPGVNVDWVVLGAGALATAVVVLALSAAAAERAIRRWRDAPARVPSAVLGALSRVPGLNLRLGSGLAFERARRSVPTASVLTSVALAVGAVVGASTFGASLAHLQASPSLYGKPWDEVLSVEDPEPLLVSDEERELVARGQTGDEPPELFELTSEVVPERAARRLADDPDIVAVSLGDSSGLDVGSIREVPSLALQPVKGALEPSIIEGRLPRSQDEIALGSRLLDQLGLGVGDTVQVESADDHVNDLATRRIVGRGVFAELAPFESLGGGAAEVPRGGGLLFLQYAAGVDRPALLERFERELGTFAVTDFELDDRLLDVEGMETTPALIAALTGFLGAATLLHFGVVAARRHARHLAVLRSLGMRRRDCVRVLVWHAVLVGGAALAIGAPLGVVAGRVAWLAIARGLYVVPVATLPSPGAALIVPVVLAAALLAAVVPGRLTTRHAPAVALRSE